MPSKNSPFSRVFTMAQKPARWTLFAEAAPTRADVYEVTPYLDALVLFAWWSGSHWTCPANNASTSLLLRDVPFVSGQPFWWRPCAHPLHKYAQRLPTSDLRLT